MKIQVTQEDITNGKKDHCIQCPIALAMIRTTGKIWEVYNTCCGRLENEFYIEHRLPQEAQVFIEAFDDGDDVSPFEFELEIA